MPKPVNTSTSAPGFDLRYLPTQLESNPNHPSGTALEHGPLVSNQTFRDRKPLRGGQHEKLERKKASHYTVINMQRILMTEALF